MGPRARRLLHTYWDHITMVNRAGGYYDTVFKGCQGATQRRPLSLTIFNVLVDAVRVGAPLVVADVGGRGSTRGMGGGR